MRYKKTIKYNRVDYAQALYKQRKESGICTQCGKRKSDPGNCFCSECKKKQKE